MALLNKLTKAAVQNAVKENKSQKLFDGGGMFLHITATGAYWRLKYYYNGKEKLYAIGVYPAVSLKQAREERDRVKPLIKQGIDPCASRKATAINNSPEKNTFETISREWWHAVHAKKVKDDYANLSLRRLEQHVFPYIGKMSCSDISASIILELLRKIEARGYNDTAHRVKNLISQVFRYAIASDRAENDPTVHLRGALAPVKSRHMAAVTDPAKLKEILNLLDIYQGGIVVRAALQLAPRFFVRPGELRHAQWAQIDFDKREWRYQAGKTDTSHIVPLAEQAIDTLEDLHAITGAGKYVFPSGRTPIGVRPMSENAVLAAIRSLGIPKEVMTGHGFRATARTLLEEVLDYPPHLIEQQLGHVVRDPNGRAYNRTAHLKKRHEMMQAWSDYLDSLKGGIK